jgi:ABC-type glycerol-3-phosphate transport system substrate-binding protein
MSDTNLQLLADSKTIVPVQSCVDEEHYDLSDYTPRAISYYTIQGALQGMPFNLSMPVLYYNKAAFRAAGLDPDKPPATLDELRDVSQKIVASGYSKFGIAFDTGPSSGRVLVHRAVPRQVGPPLRRQPERPPGSGHQGGVQRRHDGGSS